MFGLEGKKKKGEEFVFELEKELKDPKKHKELKDKVEKRIQDIKKILRDGGNKKEFERFGLILHGYTSLLKVMSRVSPK
ncbi:MAG: hypothetical protein K940chlam7_00169 [Chlamydiae bacterium]|nr:hypothetical protein [Chlamydiota bacterium]